MFIHYNFVKMAVTFVFSSSGLLVIISLYTIVRVSTAENHRRQVSQFMWDLYHKQEHQNEYLESGVQVVKSIRPKTIASMKKNKIFSSKIQHLIVFQIPMSAEKNNVMHAEVTILQNNLEPDKNLKMEIYQVENDRLTFLELGNITKILRNLKVLRLLVEIDEKQELEVLFEPTLILYYNQPTQLDNLFRNHRLGPGRSKRNAEIEEYEERTNKIWSEEGTMMKFRQVKNSCHRVPLYIDFSEIHYDQWIVAPSGYQAYQCVGKCLFPVSEHLSPTKHAILQTLVHNISPGRAFTACCVPTKLGSISVLYIDSEGVLTYVFNYDDMVVVECGCR